MTVDRERAAWLGTQILPHEPELRQWLARRLAHGSIDVDDVIQESYAVLAGLEAVGHIRNPRTYFFQVAKSIVLQTLRRSPVVTIDAFASADVMAIPSDTPTPERIAADRQQLRALVTMIGELPARCRDVFTLRKVQGLSQREVAQNLGIAESTVEKHLAKALILLGGALGRGGNDLDAASSVGEQHPEPLQRHRFVDRSRP